MPFGYTLLTFWHTTPHSCTRGLCPLHFVEGILYYTKVAAISAANDIFRLVFSHKMVVFWSKCHSGPIKKTSRFGPDNGLAPKRRQAIIWTNDGLVFWRMYESLGLCELRYPKEYLILSTWNQYCVCLPHLWEWHHHHYKTDDISYIYINISHFNNTVFRFHIQNCIHAKSMHLNDLITNENAWLSSVFIEYY